MSVSMLETGYVFPYEIMQMLDSEWINLDYTETTEPEPVEFNLDDPEDFHKFLLKVLRDNA